MRQSITFEALTQVDYVLLLLIAVMYCLLRTVLPGFQLIHIFVRSYVSHWLMSPSLICLSISCEWGRLHQVLLDCCLTFSRIARFVALLSRGSGIIYSNLENVMLIILVISGHKLKAETLFSAPHSQIMQYCVYRWFWFINLNLKVFKSNAAHVNA